MKDEEIILLIRTGKATKAFEVIYKNFPMMKKMIISSGGTSEDAKDIFQESIMIFYRMTGKPDFTLNASISTLLYSICRKLWLKKVRDQVSRESKLSEETHSELKEESVDEEWIEDSEKIKMAENVLLQLGEPCRTLLEKFYYEKFSMKEISQSMGYSNEKTAKAQKYKCIERAKKILQEKIVFLKSMLS
ncbi:MAG: sigma-70 family RNA polymerase sigma factor [Cytophagaceae bacterium]|nr:sigma-70 family RNA polymerase sigma factor [Cytophagaceae bacterium]